KLQQQAGRHRQSNAVKDLIAMRISEGYRQRDIRVSLQRHFWRFEDNDIPNYRDSAVHMEDIYNIFRKISEGAYKLHPDQITLVRLWLKDLMSLLMKNSTENTLLVSVPPGKRIYYYNALNDVEIDIRHTITRIQLNVGRMGPEERERRRREIAAQKIPDTVIEDIVEQPADYIFTVKSFTQEDVTYDVTVSNNAMTSCSCRDFQWRQSACKHMHLLHRVKPDLEILVPPQLEIANPISVRTPIESLQGDVTTDDVLLKLQIAEEQARSLMPSLTAEQKVAILQHLQAIPQVGGVESEDVIGAQPKHLGLFSSK
ncbi:hypothetical protein EC973_008639, partial [Apophysomyces ossiformis]